MEACAPNMIILLLTLSAIFAFGAPADKEAEGYATGASLLLEAPASSAPGSGLKLLKELDVDYSQEDEAEYGGGREDMVRAASVFRPLFAHRQRQAARRHRRPAPPPPQPRPPLPRRRYWWPWSYRRPHARYNPRRRYAYLRG